MKQTPHASGAGMRNIRITMDVRCTYVPGLACEMIISAVPDGIEVVNADAHELHKRGRKEIPAHKQEMIRQMRINGDKTFMIAAVTELAVVTINRFCKREGI